MFKKIKRLYASYKYFFRKGERMHCIRYWFRHNIYDPKDRIKIYTLEKGYHDCVERLIHGMFSLLVDFVEVEKAWMNLYHLKNELTRWERFKANWLGILRSPKLGLAYLDWEIHLVDERPFEEEWDDPKHMAPQSNAAKEILELYKWWKEIRPNRKGSIDESGLGKFWEDNRDRVHLSRPSLDYLDCFEMYDLLTEKEKKLERKLLDLSWKIDKREIEEDEKMLIRLVKIRQNLWT